MLRQVIVFILHGHVKCSASNSFAVWVLILVARMMDRYTTNTPLTKEYSEQNTRAFKLCHWSVTADQRSECPTQLGRHFENQCVVGSSHEYLLP